MTELAALRIGVDVGGTKIEAIALDGRGRELLKRGTLYMRRNENLIAVKYVS